MIASVLALGLLLLSIGVMIAAVVHNQLEPDYASALTLPVANGLGLLLALLALACAYAAYRKNRSAADVKRTMLLAIGCTLLLALLFPLSNLGYLGRVS